MLPCPKAVQYGRDTHQATASASPLTRPYTRVTTPAEATHETLGLQQDLEQEIRLLKAPDSPMGETLGVNHGSQAPESNTLDSPDVNPGKYSADPAPTSTAHRSAPEQNGQHSASYNAQPRSWWRRWLGW